MSNCTVEPSYQRLCLPTVVRPLRAQQSGWKVRASNGIDYMFGLHQRAYADRFAAEVAAGADPKKVLRRLMDEIMESPARRTTAKEE